MKICCLTSLIIAATVGCSPGASLVIDPFDYTAVVTSSDTVDSFSILGGEIDLDFFDSNAMFSVAATVTIGGNQLAVSGITQTGTGVGFLKFDYDGNDNDAAGGAYLLNLDATPYTGVAFDVLAETGAVTGSLQLLTESSSNFFGVSFGNIVPGQTKTILFSDLGITGSPDLANIDRIQVIFAVETGEEFTISNFRFIPEPATGALLLCSLAILGRRSRA